MGNSRMATPRPAVIFVSSRDCTIQPASVRSWSIFCRAGVSGMSVKERLSPKPCGAVFLLEYRNLLYTWIGYCEALLPKKPIGIAEAPRQLGVVSSSHYG